MAYESNQFRFPMGSAGRHGVEGLQEAVRAYVRYAGNADLGEATPRENIRCAFECIRLRLNRGYSIHNATGDLFRIAHSMMDM